MWGNPVPPAGTTDFRQHDDACMKWQRSSGALKMRTRALMVFSLAASLLFAASARAQPATPAPDYGAPITLDQAKEAAAAAQTEAKRYGWRMAIAVVDPGGYLVYFEKTDG